MKKIFIPVAVIVVILAIVAIILSKTSGGSDVGYHVHDNGEIHYDDGRIVTTVMESHTHADGEVHYGTH